MDIEESFFEILFLAVSVAFLLIFPFLFHGSFFFFGLLLLLGKIVFTTWKEKLWDSLTKLLQAPINETQLVEIETGLARLSWDTKNVQTFAYNALLELLPRVALDKSLDAKEKKLIQILWSICGSPILDEEITTHLTVVLISFAEDHTLSESEIQYIREILNTISVSEVTKQKFETTIALFASLDSIRKKENLEFIKPSLSVISQGEIAYWEGKVDLLTPKRRQVQANVTLILTNKNLHIVSDGHRRVPLADILSFRLEKPIVGDLEVITKNRKTAIWLRSPQNLVFFVYLERVLQKEFSNQS